MGMHTGIDPGLSTTALVTLDDDGKILHQYQYGSNIHDECKLVRHSKPIVKYTLYTGFLLRYLNKYKITGTVVMEDTVGNLAGKAQQLYELKGAYLISLSSFFKPEKVFMPKPNQIKKATTNDGAANKEMMVESIKKLGYNPANHHYADSIGAALMSVNGLLSAEKVEYTKK